GGIAGVRAVAHADFGPRPRYTPNGAAVAGGVATGAVHTGVAKPVILIVDDEADVVHLWQRALLMEGFEVLSAYDGITALDLAESEQPSLILLDIMMPMMSGYE